MQMESIEMVTAPPAIAALGLSVEEIAALRHQGFVCREERDRGRAYGKLRYRVHGKQHVKYLGKDDAFVRQVEQELSELQAPNQLNRTLGRLTREANQVLRSVKPRVESVLNDQGYVFHGRAVRKPRADNQ